MKNKILLLKTLSISSLDSFLNKYPKEVKAILKDPADWDYFVFAACLGILTGSSILSAQELKIVNDQVLDIDNELPKAIIDFNHFMSKVDDDTLFIPSIGLWVIWNINGETIKDREMQVLALSLGKYLMYIVKSTFDEPDN